jgi:uncharacterized protein (TIGR03437 family)
LLLFILFLAVTSQPPLLTAQAPLALTAVVNAASLVPGSLTGNSIAPGSLAYVEGAGFTPHVRLRITAARKTFDVPVLHVDPGRLLIRIPAIAPGPAILAASQRPETSLVIRIVSSDPGIFSRNGKGWGPAQAAVLLDNGRRRDISLSEPVRPGDTVRISATGIGSASPPLTVITGGVAAAAGTIREGAGDQPGEFTYRVPSTAPDGCFVPVYLRAAGPSGSTGISNHVTLPIDRAGRPCRIPDYFPFAGWFGNRAALVALARTVRDGQTVDEALASFLDLRGVSEPGGPLVYVPPPGQCGAYRAAIGPETSLSSSFTTLLLSQLKGRGLDAGRRITVALGGTLRAVPPRIGAPGVYFGMLGSDPAEAGRRALPLFYRPGEVRIASEGSRDVPAFETAAASPVPFFVNTPAPGAVHRNRDLAVSWQGLDSNQMVFALVVSSSEQAGAGGLCYCVARGDSGRVTIPAPLIGTLPATEGPAGEIVLIAMPAKPANPVPGFTHSLVLGASIRTIPVKIGAGEGR